MNPPERELLLAMSELLQEMAYQMNNTLQSGNLFNKIMKLCSATGRFAAMIDMEKEALKKQLEKYRK